jgi:PadR family transcriptional regulator
MQRTRRLLSLTPFLVMEDMREHTVFSKLVLSETGDEHACYAIWHIDQHAILRYYHITISRFDTMLRDFFLGFIKIHVLHHAAHEPIYGVAMIAELARHGYDLSPGTLYPLLHSLEEQGYLAREDRVVDGRVRKYYTITDEGSAALREAKLKIAELVHEVLEEEDQVRLPELPHLFDEEAEEG